MIFGSLNLSNLMANLSALPVKSSAMQMNATLSSKAHQSGQPRLIELTGPRIPMLPTSGLFY
jgi:hypothetical protein